MSTADERTRLLLGGEGVASLAQASVLVVGCGAVGGFALEALARAGVGRLIFVDFDIFEESNLNRQIFATTDTIGKNKTLVVKERLLKINPKLQVEPLQLMVESQTLSQLFDTNPDFVIDAIDSLQPKTILLEALVQRQIPFISSMGAALKKDITRIRITSMKKTIECPLAAFVRKRLRRRGVNLDFPVVFSDECVSDKKALGEQTTVSCGCERRTMGSLVTITGVFGLMCAHAAISYLTQRDTVGERLSERIV